MTSRLKSFVPSPQSQNIQQIAPVLTHDPEDILSFWTPNNEESPLDDFFWNSEANLPWGSEGNWTWSQGQNCHGFEVDYMDEFKLVHTSGYQQEPDTELWGYVLDIRRFRRRKINSRQNSALHFVQSFQDSCTDTFIVGRRRWWSRRTTYSPGERVLSLNYHLFVTFHFFSDFLQYE
jgi:hypothetical protein